VQLLVVMVGNSAGTIGAKLSDMSKRINAGVELSG